jgi:AraC-like DNA-binding protein
LQYKEYAASPELGRFVHCLWTLEGHLQDLDAAAQPVLPDGRTELILHLGDPFERVDPSLATERQPAIIFAGQLTGPLTLRPTGRIAVVGVRFQPDGAAALLPAPQHALAGLTIDLGSLSAPLARAVGEIGESASSVAEATGALNDCLAQHVVSRRLDDHVGSAVREISRSRGLVSVDTLAHRSGITRRHLERRFRDLVGMSPKRLARITRFQHALRMFERMGSPQRGTRTATSCGYADQAHFIREFRELAGCSPETHLIRAAVLSGFFAEPISSHGRPEL